MTDPAKPVLFGRVEGVNPVSFNPDQMFYGSMPCEAHSISHEITRLFDEWARDYEARMTPEQRARQHAVLVGHDWFDERAVRRRLEDAGVRVEDHNEGWVIHFPAQADGSVEMPPLVDLTELLLLRQLEYAMPTDRELWRDLYLARPEPREPAGPDYLKHDPTKRHRRRR
jgi:hypothetical protein